MYLFNGIWYKQKINVFSYHPNQNFLCFKMFLNLVKTHNSDERLS